MPRSQHAWIINTGLEAVGAVAEAVRKLAEPVLGEEGASDVELALVEALTNVIRHGYGESGGPIRVEAKREHGDFAVRLSDWGRPIPGDALTSAGLNRFDFDPDDIAALPTSGMGLSLITTLMDDVGYTSDRGQNTLLMRRGPRH